MTKRPPIKNKSFKFCFACKTKYENEDELIQSPANLKTGGDKTPIKICKKCFPNFCEECRELVKHITNRRDPDNRDRSHLQLCNDCYEEASYDIVECDKSYGINGIDKTKGNVYGDYN